MATRKHGEVGRPSGVTATLRESPPEWPKASISLALDRPG
jgi:hypothetical protein